MPTTRSGNRDISQVTTITNMPAKRPPPVPGSPPPVTTGYDGAQHARANDYGDLVTTGGGGMGEIVGANDYMESMSEARNARAHGSQVGSDTHRDNMSYAGGAFATFNLAFDISKTVQMFMDADTTGQERAGALIGNVGGVGATAAAFSKIAETAQGGDAAPEVTKAANAVLGEIAGILGVIKSGYELVRQIVELINDADDLEGDQTGGRVVDIVRSALEAGKGTIETINAFMDHLGTVTGPMLQAAPGIGIAMGVLDVISQGIKIAYAAVAWGDMRDDKRATKEKLIGKPPTKTWYQFGNPSAQAEADKIISSRAALKAERAALLKAGPGTSARSAATHGTKLADIDARLTAGKDKNRQAKEYLLAKDLQRVAAKRIRRAALNIGTALPGIAGDIAVLSGVGAGVGGGLKAAGSGVKLGAVGFRMLKQAYHDRGDGTKSAKSTRAKEHRYDEMIQRMTKNMLRVNAGTDPLEKKQALNRVLASGMTPATMNEHRANGPKLYKAWVAALKKRD